ncbi:MAG: flap endonuclease-1 [Nanoarchaeota archaeon]|nr:flap endonuclease-1 [Nanoarchaeota archaeon]
MGTKIYDIIPKKEIDLKFLNSKVLALDAHLQLYQFLSTIRQRDGSLLTDSRGNVTSHMTGLFTRTASLLQKNIKLMFVFDGKPPELKKGEWEKRRQAKAKAQKKYEAAVATKDLESMKKYASRTSRLTKDMINEAKDLIKALGIPIIDSPSEGEAQAAHIVKKGHAFAVATQDADALIFGAPRVIKNLAVSGRRKKAGTLSYQKTKPELINLADTLNILGIDQDQLVALSMLVGTDYNNGGIRGIGSKNALKLVKKHGNNLDALFKEVKWDDSFDFTWTELFYIIKKMPVTDDYNLKWSEIDPDKVIEILCEKHEFSRERIEKTLDKIFKPKSKHQKGLSQWF